MAKLNVLPLIPDDLKELFGKRPLVAGEKASDYDALLSRIVAAIAPEDFIIWLYVKDIADLTWEIQRYRRWMAAIINNGRLEALGRLLRPIIAGMVPGFAAEQRTSVFAVKLWSEDPKEKEAVKLLMAKFAFDDTSISAEAFIERLPTIEMIERLQSSAGRRRERTLKEIDRYRAKYSRRARDVVDAESIEILEDATDKKHERHKLIKKERSITSSTST